MEDRTQRIAYSIVGLIALFVIVITWIQVQPKYTNGGLLDVDTKASRTEVVLPEFVSIALQDNKRVLVHEQDRYTLLLEDNWSVYPNNFGEGISVQDFIEPEPGYGGMPGCRVVLNNSEATIIQYIQEEEYYCKNNLCIVEVSNESDWIIVKSIGEFVGSGDPTYLQEIDNETYLLHFSCANDNFINTVTSNLNI
jgi:hypothetical protein